MTHDSLEDSALRIWFTEEQIVKMHTALEEGEKSLNVILAIAKMVSDELPRAQRTVATLRDMIATFNANQRRFRNG